MNLTFLAVTCFKSYPLGIKRSGKSTGRIIFPQYNFSRRIQFRNFWVLPFFPYPSASTIRSSLKSDIENNYIMDDAADDNSSLSLSPPVVEEVEVTSPDTRLEDSISPLSMKSPSPPTFPIPYVPRELQDHLSKKKGSHWSPGGKELGVGRRGPKPIKRYEDESESELESATSPSRLLPIPEPTRARALPVALPNETPDSPNSKQPAMDLNNNNNNDEISEIRRLHGPATKKRRTGSGSQPTDLINRRVVKKIYLEWTVIAKPIFKGRTRKKTTLAFGTVSLREETGDDTWHITFDRQENKPEIWTRKEVTNGIAFALKYANYDRSNIRTDGTKAPPPPPLPSASPPSPIPVSYYLYYSITN